MMQVKDFQFEILHVPVTISFYKEPKVFSNFVF